MGDMTGAYMALVGVGGGHEGKREFGKHKRRCEESIKMDLLEVGWGVMDWIDLAQDRNRCSAIANAVMDIRAS